MQPEFWASLHDAPAGLGIAAVSILLQFGFIFADAQRLRAVKGTRRQYAATTWATTLAFPALLAVGLDTVVDFCARNWFGTGIGVLVFLAIMHEWRLIRDSGDDNWWKGRGTRIGRSIRSFLTAPPRVDTAGSGT